MKKKRKKKKEEEMEEDSKARVIHDNVLMRVTEHKKD